MRSLRLPIRQQFGIAGASALELDGPPGAGVVASGAHDLTNRPEKASKAISDSTGFAITKIG